MFPCVTAPSPRLFVTFATKLLLHHWALAANNLLWDVLWATNSLNARGRFLVRSMVEARPAALAVGALALVVIVRTLSRRSQS